MAARKLLALAIATLTVGAVGCAASTGGSTGTTSSPDPAVSASPVTAPLIPAASVVPTTLPTTVPTTVPTAVPTPSPKPTEVPATPVAGRFKVVQTVTKSNRATVPVGQKDSYSWTLTVLCEPACAATAPGGNTKVKGRTWSYSFTSETVCYRLNTAGKKYDKKKGSTKSKAVLTFSKPSRGKPQTFTGTIKERLKKECPGYEGEFEPWAVDYKLKGTFAGTRK
jgi:hypothetical protein